MIKVRARRIEEAAILAIAVLFILYILLKFYPIGWDWRIFKEANVAKPYLTLGFISPPWILLLLPHKLLSLEWSNVLNLLINIIIILIAIRKLGGSRMTTILVITCPAFIEFVRTNNIEWIPLLGLLVSPYLGGLFLSCKPQVLSGALLIWMKRDWRVILVPLSVLLLSFVIWGWWPAQIGEIPFNHAHNFSPFPIGIPYGIYLLGKAWKEDDPYLAAVATPFFTPYLSPVSLVTLLVVTASKWPKAGYWMYFGQWIFTIAMYRRLILLGLPTGW